MKNDTLINIGFIILAVVLGYFVYEWTHKPVIIEKKVVLTDFEIQKITQKARLGYIPEDSVKSLLKGLNWKPATKINPAIGVDWLNSIKWNPKDSTIYNYKDSVIVRYPIYESDSTFTVEKKDSIQNVSVNIQATLKQRFLPLQEMFASEFQIDTLSISYLKEIIDYNYDFALYGGARFKTIEQNLKANLFIGAEYKLINKKHYELIVQGEAEFNGINFNSFNNSVQLTNKLKF